MNDDTGADNSAREYGGTGESQEFFSISLPRFVLFEILTLGLFQVYWFYRNWEYVNREIREVSPLARSVFPVFFCYPLFKEIFIVTRPEEERSNHAAAWACVFIVASFFGGLPGWYELLGLLSTVPLLYFQSLVNARHRERKVDTSEDRRITLGQLCFLVAGLILWVAVFQSHKRV